MDQPVQSGGIAWVLAASPIWNVEAGTGWLPRPDHVVAADGGAAIAARLGITPDLALGDFDSSDPTLITRWREAGVQTRAYSHDTKLETNTELAALAALEFVPSRIYILGGTGGRFDHTLANVLLLTHPDLIDADVRLVEGRQEVYLAKPGIWNPVEGEPGDTMTLLPIGGDVTGVSLDGLRYPLNAETLPQGKGRGVSNVIETAGARLRFESGLLLVVVLHRTT